MTSGAAHSVPAYWGGYSVSKAALNALVKTYAAETQNISALCVNLFSPGPTRTKMRALAYPGEDPASLKAPEIIAERIVGLLTGGFETGHRERID